MNYYQNLIIPQDIADKIRHYCTSEPRNETECLGEGETIVETAVFHTPQGQFEMDIKCCGVQYEEGESNKAFVEAVLFDHAGRGFVEVACTDVSDNFFDSFELEFEGNTFRVDVQDEKENAKVLPTERVIDLFRKYVENDAKAADPNYARDALRQVCSEEELDKLGFTEYFAFEEEYER